MSLVGEAPRLWFSDLKFERGKVLVVDLKFVVVTKVSLGKTDGDDAVNLDELMSKVAMRSAGGDDDIV